MDQLQTGALIAALRKEKGYTQQQLADKIHVSNKTISKWEHGDGYPDLANFPLLSESLDVTMDELLRGELLTSTKADDILPEPPSSCTHALFKNPFPTRTALMIAASYAGAEAIAVILENIAFHCNLFILGDIQQAFFWLLTAYHLFMAFRKHKDY